MAHHRGGVHGAPGTVKDITTNHDVGFVLYAVTARSRLTGNPAYRDVLLQGAKSLSTRFNPRSAYPLVGLRHLEISRHHR